MHLHLSGACFLIRECESSVPNVRPFAAPARLGN